MIRSSSLARRTPLNRGTKPLRRKTRMKQRREKPRRSGRVRNPAFMAWVRRQPCAVRIEAPDPNRLTPCTGRLESDHQGWRPKGRKSNDDECVPMCKKHHAERTAQWGCFRELDQEQLRAWGARAIERTQAEWRQTQGNAPQPAAEGATEP